MRLYGVHSDYLPLPLNVPALGLKRENMRDTRENNLQKLCAKWYLGKTSYSIKIRKVHYCDHKVRQISLT